MIEGTYKLPEGWRWVKLGEVVRTQSGNSKLIKGRLSPKPGPGLFPAYSASGQDVWHSPPEHSGTAIILSAVGARCGKCFLAHGQWSAIANTHIIWPLEEVIDAKFLWFLVNDESFWVKGKSAQPFVKVKATLEKEIPLPPLPEQRRIVARIEELMGRIREARRLREEAMRDVERLWQAVLAETFPRPGSELPESWRWVRLGEVLELKNGKFIRKSELAESGPVRVYGSNGVIGFVREGKALVNRETLAIGRVGASGAVNWVTPPAWISDNAMYVAELAPNCDLKYLFHALQQSGLSSLAKQGAQPLISQEQVYQVCIPLPPLPEQQRIVAHLEAVQERIRALKEAQAQTEAELRRLEQAVLEKAFRGEL